METIFMNTKNSKTSQSNIFRYNFTDKLDLKNPNKTIALVNLSIYYTWKNIKSGYNNNKFKKSAPTWNDTFDVSDGSYSISALQNYFEYITKKHETITDTSPILIYVNNIINRIVFKIKSRYKLELLSKETMRLLGSKSNIIDADKNSELVPKLENVDLALMHCNLVNNYYQQDSIVLFTFVSDKGYGQLMTIHPESLIMLKTVNTEFSLIEIQFTDQDNRSLEIEDSVNISLIVGVSNYLWLKQGFSSLERIK